MNDGQDNTPGMDARRALNWFMTATEAPAMTLKVFLHYRFGSQQPGLAGLLAFVILYGFIGSCPPYSPRPLIGFAGLFLLALICRRIGAGLRSFRGNDEHSWFDGYSIVSRVLPFIGDETAKRYVEPLLSLGVAIACVPWSPPLGVYLITATFCLALITHARASIQYRQLKRMRDMYIEQKNRARSVRAFIDNGRF